MKPASIELLRSLASAHRAKGVLVLFVGDEGFSWTSYGTDRDRCRKMRRFAEEILAPLERGDVVPWRRP